MRTNPELMYIDALKYSFSIARLKHVYQVGNIPTSYVCSWQLSRLMKVLFYSVVQSSTETLEYSC